MFNNPAHRRLLARLLKVELEVIPNKYLQISSHPVNLAIGPNGWPLFMTDGFFDRRTD